MTCLMDGYASYDYLVDPMGQVKADVVNPPNYTTTN